MRNLLVVLAVLIVGCAPIDLFDGTDFEQPEFFDNWFEPAYVTNLGSEFLATHGRLCVIVRSDGTATFEFEQLDTTDHTWDLNEDGLLVIQNFGTVDVQPLDGAWSALITETVIPSFEGRTLVLTDCTL